MAKQFSKHACTCLLRGFPCVSAVKNLPANAGNSGDAGSIPGSWRSSGGGNGNPLQYSRLENTMDRGAWWAIVPWGRKKVRHDWSEWSMVSGARFATCVLGTSRTLLQEVEACEWLGFFLCIFKMFILLKKISFELMVQNVTKIWKLWISS